MVLFLDAENAAIFVQTRRTPFSASVALTRFGLPDPVRGARSPARDPAGIPSVARPLGVYAQWPRRRSLTRCAAHTTSQRVLIASRETGNPVWTFGRGSSSSLFYLSSINERRRCCALDFTARNTVSGKDSAGPFHLFGLNNFRCFSVTLDNHVRVRTPVTREL